MKLARICIFPCLCVLSGISFVYSPAARALENRFLEIVHVNVGQGDATLIISPNGKTMLIDGGDTGKGNRVIVPLLKARGIDHLDYIVATHYDADHIGGLDEVINHFQGRIGKILDRGRAGRKKVPGSKAYAQYVTSGKLDTDRDPVSLGSAGFAFDDELRVTVVAAGGCVLGQGHLPVAARLDENSVSVALVISYGRFDYFIGGDLTGGGRSGSRRTPDIETSTGLVVGDIDVLKLSHHGSETSSNEMFLAATSPEVAIASVGNDGKNRRYHHPKRSVLDRLHDLKAAGVLKRLYSTNQGETDGGLETRDHGLLKIAKGDVVLRTDGNRYSVNNDWYVADGVKSRVVANSPGQPIICGKGPKEADDDTTS
jgi:beta-lactamase superfamily II metal-dependent hydrolase